MFTGRLRDPESAGAAKIDGVGTQSDADFRDAEVVVDTNAATGSKYPRRFKYFKPKIFTYTILSSKLHSIWKRAAFRPRSIKGQQIGKRYDNSMKRRSYCGYKESTILSSFKMIITN